MAIGYREALGETGPRWTFMPGADALQTAWDESGEACAWEIRTNAHRSRAAWAWYEVDLSGYAPGAIAAISARVHVA
jgi:hypothetical protein